MALYDCHTNKDVKQRIAIISIAAQWLCLFYIFVMFSTFRDEMQYIFLEKNFIFMVFLVVKDVGTDVI